MTKKELITAIVEARPEEYKETVLHKMKKAELEEIHGRIYFGDSSIAADEHAFEDVSQGCERRECEVCDYDDNVEVTILNAVKPAESTETPLNGSQTAGKVGSGTNTHSDTETENVAQYNLLNSRGLVKATVSKKEIAEQLAKSTGYSIQKV